MALKLRAHAAIYPSRGPKLDSQHLYWAPTSGSCQLLVTLAPGDPAPSVFEHTALVHRYIYTTFFFFWPPPPSQAPPSVAANLIIVCTQNSQLTKCIWKSEDNLQAPLFSFYVVGSRNPAPAIRLWQVLTQVVCY